MPIRFRQLVTGQERSVTVFTSRPLINRGHSEAGRPAKASHSSLTAIQVFFSPEYRRGVTAYGTHRKLGQKRDVLRTDSNPL